MLGNCDRTLDEAFQDLRGLMANAQEMVQLAERFRETLAARGGAAESSDVDMQQQLIEIGIASPVTKDTAGARYHQQLSSQVHFNRSATLAHWSFRRR